MDYRVMIVGSAGIGAGLMYLLDDQSGRRRRAIIRDKVVHGAHVTGTGLGKISRDTRNRLQGTAAELKNVFLKQRVDDIVLVERVRSNLGTAVSHPGSIHVQANAGQVKLTGVVLSAEVDDLIKQVKSTRGVREVRHHLDIHDKPDRVPGLQGDASKRLSGGRFELMQVNWSPAARLFTGLTAGALIAYGLRDRSWPGAVAAATGLPLLARSVTNMPLRRMVGASGRRGVDVQKSININAPVEEVFNTMNRVEDYPGFMTHVRKVSKVDQDRYRWAVAGPAGTTVGWDSVFTSIVPNRQLAWRSEPGSMVKHAGIMKFGTNPDGSTALNVHLTYNPLVGGIGHALLTLLGADPKTLLDEELLRVKTYLEKGKKPRDAAARR